mmetsp:Transcript_20935/g.31163  ORF Transcript_20935/g.31163 Transcript_20935/m.31163 type:complete len:207 (+) Transcript_20935:2-622(+)
MMWITNTLKIMASTIEQRLAALKQFQGHEIVKGSVWLGSGRDAQKLEKLEEIGITDILNCADDVPNYHQTLKLFKYTNLDVADFGADKGISRVFEQSNALIKDIIEDEKRSVFVHCAAGQNRSPTIVIAAIMTIHKISLKEAYVYVRTRRPGICPFRDNRAELIKYEKQLYGKTTMSEDSFLEFNNWRLNDDGTLKDDDNIDTTEK